MADIVSSAPPNVEPEIDLEEIIEQDVRTFLYTQTIPNSVVGPLKNINWMILHYDKVRADKWLDLIFEISLTLLHPIVTKPLTESVTEQLIDFAASINNQANAFKPSSTKDIYTTILLSKDRKFINVQLKEMRN